MAAKKRAAKKKPAAKKKRRVQSPLARRAAAAGMTVKAFKSVTSPCCVPCRKSTDADPCH